MVFFVVMALQIGINFFVMDDYVLYKTRMDLETSLDVFAERIKVLKPEEVFRDLNSEDATEFYMYDSRLIRMNQNGLAPLLQKDIARMYYQAKNQADNMYYEVFGFGDYDEKRMAISLVLPHGDMILVAKSLGVVTEVIEVIFTFLLITSIILYLFGLLMVGVISNRMSRPICQMEKVTKKMSDMNFDEVLIETGDDEIGRLTKSINVLAQKLSLTVNELNASNEKLSAELKKERNIEKMRRRFVSDVSHELKNPISMILGYAEGLKKDIPKSPEDKEYYHQVILDESNRMNQLIKDLLDLSSIDSGILKLVIEEVDMTAICNNIVERYRHIAVEKEVDVVVESKCSQVFFGDQLRIGQVVINLLSNAYKYVNHQGEILIELSDNERFMTLKVMNTGNLLSESEFKNIWHSFYQIDSSSKGHGLGLTIVKGIVELHKGSCYAYKWNKYNCFEVRIPLMDK